MEPSVKSFAARARDALTREDGPRQKKACCRYAELSGYLLSNATFTLIGGHGIGLTLRTEHPGTARWVVKHLREEYLVMPVIRIVKAGRLGGRTTFEMRMEQSDAQTVMQASGLFAVGREIPRACLTRKCCRAALLRGFFLGCGTLSDPERGYRLEFVLPEETLAQALIRFLHAFYAIRARLTPRKDAAVVYVADSEDVIQILSLIGAHGAVLEMENMRILRDARNRANRAANCDTANITKMLGAADRQNRAIEVIERTIGLNALPDALREIAEERARHADASLEELGAMLEPPVGKSGVYHRLRRIEAIARSIEQQEKM